MKKLLTSLLFVFAALFAVDRIGGQIMWWVSQHTQSQSVSKLKYLANEVDADVVLLGTSRCQYHYVSSILADSIDMSVYNGGFSGSDCIYAHYIALNLILLHHSPKMICLDLMTHDYTVFDDSFNKTNFFAPYIGRSERADSIFREAGNYWPYRLCHLYRYNARAISSICKLFINGQQGDKGYYPLSSMFVPDKLDKVHKSENVDTLKLQYLRKFITLCKSHHIALVFTVSPAYSEADADLYDVLKDVAKENGIPFFDYHTQGLFLDHPEYFKDNGHLWDKGARVYTSIFAHDLKRYINSIRPIRDEKQAEN